MKRVVLIIPSILLIIFISSCNENSISSNQFESETDESRVITLTTQTNLTVENTNGNIIISASDTASNIYCGITKKVRSKKSESDAQSHLSAIDITIEKNNMEAKIKVDHPINDDRTYEVSFDILLPNNFNYNLTLGNGNVLVNSITKTLVINLGNGNVQTDVVLIDTCFVSASVGNGNINLIIPDNTNAIVSASVGNGTISNTGLSFQDQNLASQQFSGTLGNGAGSIILNLGNGNITMDKK